MSKEELLNVRGGSLSASLINALARGANTLYNIGAALGNSLKLIIYGKKCN